VAARVVTIDGPAGSGKSTLAERLARTLGLPYVNTGLMYRAVTLRALREGVDLENGPALGQVARGIRFDLSSRFSPPAILIDREPPSTDLVAPEVEVNVSTVSRHPEVRAVLRNEQRRLGSDGAVMEGRDIGSMVFPDAAVKIFLVAAPDERAARRVRERGGHLPSDGAEPASSDGPTRTPDVAEALATRDAMDERVNPFVPAPDAVLLDTTGKDPEGVLREALAIARERLEASGG
jgi:cytidylate kinase